MSLFTSASRGSSKSVVSAVFGKSVELAGHVLFDRGDAILADAQRVVAAERKIGPALMLVHVGDGEKPGEARHFKGLSIGVRVRRAL